MVTISRRHYRFDMNSTSQRYGFDVEIIIISMSNTYRNDNVVTISQRYGFDVITISIRCRIHMVTISQRHYRFDIDSMSLRYLYDVESISLRHRNDVIVTIWIQHQIHIIMTSNPYRCD